MGSAGHGSKLFLELIHLAPQREIAAYDEAADLLEDDVMVGKLRLQIIVIDLQRAGRLVLLRAGNCARPASGSCGSVSLSWLVNVVPRQIVESAR